MGTIYRSLNPCFSGIYSLREQEWDIIVFQIVEA